MKVELIDYQKKAAQWMLERLNTACDLASLHADKTRETLSLSAPTGAGKTVIMAAVVEAVLTGSFDGRDSPHSDRKARFLWLTDSPDLNRQTLKRFEVDSNLHARQLVVINEATFTEERLPEGTLCFLNTQKLSEQGKLSQQSDHRQHTFWQVMDATLEQAPGSTIVLIDEAHRGMTGNKTTHTKARKSATTITARFLEGYTGQYEQALMRAPHIVVGISATPIRFRTRVSEVGRSLHPYDVKPEQVRRSGLLKQQVRVRHTPGEELVTATLAKQATLRRREFAEKWQQTAPSTGSASIIRPALLIQVEDGKESSSDEHEKLSATDLDEVIRAVDKANEEIGERWADSHFAHCFGDHKPIRAAGRDIRYLEPEAISEDPNVDVVLFKTALTTGWDCPRAEVLISYRVAEDKTHIAQLIGRMVRAPLRRAIEPGPHSDLLNGVDLYLPRFNDQALDEVVSWLTSSDIDDSTSGLITEVIRTVDLKLTNQIADYPELRHQVEKALASLPSFDPPPRNVGGPVKRLRSLTGMLERNVSGGNPVLDSATEEARKKITERLAALINETKSNPKWDTARDKVSTTEISTRFHDVIEAKAADKTQSEKVIVSTEDIVNLVERLDKEIGMGIINTWMENRLYNDEQPEMPITSVNVRECCIELLTAFEVAPEIRDHIDIAADRLTQDFYEHYKTEINDLPSQERKPIESLISPPLKATLRQHAEVLPERIVMRLPTKQAPEMAKHLYVYATEDNPLMTRVALNRWEREAVAKFTDSTDVIAWFRNTRSASQWHLAIPYCNDPEKSERLMFPDIIVLRRTQTGDVAVQIIDPHSLHLSDAASKLRGLAQWAGKADNDPTVLVDSVLAVAGIDGKLFYQDLMNPDIRDEALKCRDSSNMKRWFRSGQSQQVAEEPKVSAERERNDDNNMPPRPSRSAGA